MRKRKPFANITDEQIDAIEQSLIQQAIQGDRRAIKLIFQYLYGKPAARKPEENQVSDEEIQIRFVKHRGK